MSFKDVMYFNFSNWKETVCTDDGKWTTYDGNTDIGGTHGRAYYEAIYTRRDLRNNHGFFIDTRQTLHVDSLGSGWGLSGEDVLPAGVDSGSLGICFKRSVYEKFLSCLHHDGIEIHSPWEGEKKWVSTIDRKSFAVLLH